MRDPKTISIKDFTYSLPDERIARYPLPERDASKLLIYKNGIITQTLYRDLAGHIPPGSLLILNDTNVVEARILFQKQTGGIIEIFCLEPHEKGAEINSSMLCEEKIQWNCLIGGASKWKHGQILEKKTIYGNKHFTLRAKYIEKLSDCFVIEFSWDKPGLSFAGMLHLAGAIPLPPYMKRDAKASDAERYQTIYAQSVGSVAAPTAGLHFTESLFENLHEKNIKTCFVTLHVGAATFKPVKAETIGEHEMHAEFIDVSRELIETLIKHKDKIIVAVGTTSFRAIESLYWLGAKIAMGKHLPENNGKHVDLNQESIEISQWEPYELISSEPANVLQSLLDWMRKNELKRLTAKTRFLVAPGYKSRIFQGVITNFHQPESTLLLLIAALIGNDWKKVYGYALQNDFRFLSYGDGCLLWLRSGYGLL